MRAKKRTYQLHDFDVECPVCHRHFISPQGMKAHLRLTHRNNREHAPGYIEEGPMLAGLDLGADMSIANITNETLRRLRDEVTTLKLQSEKRKLQAEFPSAEKKASDIMEQLGLGGFDTEVKAAVQRRLLGLGMPDPDPKPNWLEKLLSTDHGVTVAVHAIRGALGIKDRDDNLASLLKDMGYSLKDLITQANSPKAPEGFTIGGINLTGTNITGDVLKSILEYKKTEEQVKADYEGRKLMADQLAELIAIIRPEIGKILRNRLHGIANFVPTRETQQQEITLTCAQCGHTYTVQPDEYQPGSIFHCPIPGCSYEWLVQLTEEPNEESRPDSDKE